MSTTSIIRMAICPVVTGALAVGVAIIVQGCGASSHRDSVAPVALDGGSVVDKLERFDGQKSEFCANDQSVDTSIYVDGSLSSRGLGERRLPVIVDFARPTAICGGTLRIVIFTGSVSESTVVVNSDFDPGDGTATSQVLKADEFIGDLIGPLERDLESITGPGTDLLAVLSDEAEARAQLPAENRSRLLIITDGKNTVGPRITPHTSVAEATAMGSEASVPDLNGTQVAMTGIGLVGGTHQPSTAYTEALKAFMAAICQASNATCSAPTTSYVNQ